MSSGKSLRKLSSDELKDGIVTVAIHQAQIGMAVVALLSDQGEPAPEQRTEIKKVKVAVDELPELTESFLELPSDG